jgi:ubiquinone/menaquinone biosynthesis C-methylase UbiE
MNRLVHIRQKVIAFRHLRSFTFLTQPIFKYTTSNQLQRRNMPENKFVPEQALKFDGALLQELQGNVSEGIAQELLKIVPPIKSGFVIHDNGCGYGAVTGEIMNSGVPSDIKIHATDKKDDNLAQLRATLAENPSWPVEVAEVNAHDLTFPDNYFDLSITDFVLLGLDDEVGAARHILRTVKPGGTAAIAVWKEKPWQDALKEAHRRTRGDDAPIPPWLAIVDYDRKKLQTILEEAGHENTKFVERSAWLHMADPKRWATIAWTFLATPAGGWQKSDQDMWDETIEIAAEELQKGDWHVFEDGVHKIRMVATIAVTEKQ